MSEKLLEMRNISKEFPGVKALDNVTIDLVAGEVHGLLGENGAGKSTLIKILAGDYYKDKGEISINGEAVNFKTPLDSQNRGIRVIYQELNTLDTLSVAENIFVGSLPLKKGFRTVDWKKLNRDAKEVLLKMNVDINPKKIAGDLTVHEKQIVEVAKAIYKKANILVMDEPTAVLGEKDTESLFKIIETLKKQGVGIIYISHRMEEVFQITDRVTVLRDGKKIGTLITKETDRDTLISMMVGRELKEMYPKREIPIGDVLMDVEGLTIENIIDNVSFQLRAGEILGVFGLLGSGKQNIIRALYGIEKIDSGKISIEGETVLINSPEKALNLKMGFLPIDKT